MKKQRYTTLSARIYNYSISLQYMYKRETNYILVLSGGFKVAFSKKPGQLEAIALCSSSPLGYAKPSQNPLTKPPKTTRNPSTIHQKPPQTHPQNHQKSIKTYQNPAFPSVFCSPKKRLRPHRRRWRNISKESSDVWRPLRGRPTNASTSSWAFEKVLAPCCCFVGIGSFV